MMRFAFYEKISDFRPKHIFPKKQVYDIFPGHAVPIFFRAKISRAVPCQYFSVPRFSVPCHKSAGPPCRAVPGRP